MIWILVLLATSVLGAVDVELYYEFGPNVVARSERLFCEAAMQTMGNLSLSQAEIECDLPQRDVREFVEFGRWMSARMVTTVVDGLVIGSPTTRKNLDDRLIANGFYVTNDTGIGSISYFDKNIALTAGLITFDLGLCTIVWVAKYFKITKTQSPVIA